MQAATTLILKEVRAEVTSMSPVFLDDRLCVRKVLRELYQDAKQRKVPYSFINQLKRDLKRLGFNV